jgi:hypothetical protein
LVDLGLLQQVPKDILVEVIVLLYGWTGELRVFSEGDKHGLKGLGE